MPTESSQQWEKELKGSSRPLKLVNSLLSVVNKIETAYDKEINSFNAIKFVKTHKLSSTEALRDFTPRLERAATQAQRIISDTALPLQGQILDYIQGQARAYRPKAAKITLPRSARDNYVRAAKSYIQGETKDIRADAKRTVANWLSTQGEIGTLREALSSLLERSKGHAATVFRSEIQNAYVALVKEGVSQLGAAQVKRIVSSSACSTCQGLEGLHDKDSADAYKVPHPNCACTFEVVITKEDAKMAKQPLSHSDIRNLLSTAIGPGSYENGNYVWIRDVFDNYFVYQEGESSTLWKCTYSIDKDNNVSLGQPEQVIVKTTYETVAIMSLFSAGPAVAEVDGYVIRSGKIFEAGDYPDKDISITETELASAVKEFKPVQIDYEHVSGPLDGKLGTLKKVWADGIDLYGSVEMPKWLDDALGEAERKVSTTWNRATKRLSGLALVVNPRVSDAALMAAFAGARHNKDDAADIQAVHDLSVKQGAVCSTKESKMAKNEKDVQTQGEKEEVGFKEAFLRFLGLSEANLPVPIKVTQLAPAMAEVPAEFKNRLEAMEAALTQARADKITAEAVAFADAEIHASRSLPTTREALIGEYTEAATDDVAHPREVTFTALKDNVATQLKGTRVDALRARHLALPAHNLTKEGLGDAGRVQALFNQQTQSGGAEEEQGIKPEEYQALMSATPLGRAILAEKAKAAKSA